MPIIINFGEFGTLISKTKTKFKQIVNNLPKDNDVADCLAHEIELACSPNDLAKHEMFKEEYYSNKLRYDATTPCNQLLLK